MSQKFSDLRQLELLPAAPRLALVPPSPAGADAPPLRLPRARPRSAGGRPPQPTHDEIAAAQAELLDLLEIPPEDAARCCWACRAMSFRFRGNEVVPVPGELGWLERAHVVAHAAGGSNEPSNYFLLCATCHREQPDSASPAVQVAWLRTHESETARMCRMVGPVIARLKKFAALMGGDEVLAAWAKSLGATHEEVHRSLKALMKELAGDPGGHHHGNVVQSARWGIVDAFVSWARAHA
jgi:hypothetical protein